MRKLILLAVMLCAGCAVWGQDTALVRVVREHAVAGEYGQVLALVDGAMAANPDSAVLYFFQGVALAGEGRNAEAIKAYDTAIKLEPWVLDPYLERARSGYAVGRTESALKDIRHCLKEDPAMLDALLLRAEILLDQGDFTGALEDLERGRRIDGKEVAVYCLKAEVYWTLGDVKNSLKEANYAVRLAPVDPMPYATRANAHLVAGSFAAALADADKAIELAPEAYSLLNTRAFVHLEMDDLKAAHADLDLYLDKDSLAYDAHLTRALLYERAGDLGLAVKAVEVARGIRAGDMGIEEQLGFLLLRLGQDSSAVAVLEPVVAGNPERAFALSALGLAHARRGNVQQGLKELDRAVKLDGYDPRAYYHRALVHFMLDKKEKGCADLEAAEGLGFSELYGAEEMEAVRGECGGE